MVRISFMVVVISRIKGSIIISNYREGFCCSSNMVFCMCSKGVSNGRVSCRDRICGRVSSIIMWWR